MDRAIRRHDARPVLSVVVVTLVSAGSLSLGMRASNCSGKHVPRAKRDAGFFVRFQPSSRDPGCYEERCDRGQVRLRRQLQDREESHSDREADRWAPLRGSERERPRPGARRSSRQGDAQEPEDHRWRRIALASRRRHHYGSQAASAEGHGRGRQHGHWHLQHRHPHAQRLVDHHPQQ